MACAALLEAQVSGVNMDLFLLLSTYQLCVAVPLLLCSARCTACEEFV